MTIKDSKIWTVIISINPTDIPVVPSVFHSRRWVMDTLLVCDSLPGDGADTRMTTWDYACGYYDRVEREFLGFAKITTENLNADGIALRSTERYYSNSDIHTSGQMLAEVLYDSLHRKYIQTVNTLEKDTLAGFEELSAARVFPKLTRTQTCYFEGQPQAGITAVQTYTYENTYGNLVHQTSESTSQPLIHTNISYHPQQNGNYCVNRPSDVEIRDAGGCLRRRTTRIDPMGHITEIHDTVDSYQVLVTRMRYDAYGNVVTLRGPNTTMHYTYDNSVHSYPVEILDTFNVSSRMQDYDFRFGLPRTVIDQADNCMEYTYDSWGRTLTVRGPKEIAAQVPYTIKHTYSGREAATGSTRPRAVSMAVTEHYDPQHPQNPIKTYTYCDGLGRIVQTRKEAAVNGVEKLVISGHTVVDALGRTVETYYPTEIHRDSTRFRFITDNSAPASTVTYDVLDRPKTQTAPDGSTTGFEYGFAYNNDLNKMLFSTVITDANGHSSTELKDVDGKPWVIQPAGQQPVYFNYNSVGDNTRVYSSITGDWSRNYTYDQLGRRLTYTEGELWDSYTYNGMNLSSHRQRWQESGQHRTKTTHYHYTAHRLDSVRYDDALTTIYHYNAAGQPDSVYDESGVMCYQYGNMGEVTKETRIYALPFLSQPIALSTQFSYDSWGRVQSITYPDGEVVHYAYDLGGQLERMYNSSYTYLDDVAYDRFGAKVSQEYGNGMVTSYTYDSYTRRLSQITVADNSNNPYGDIQYGYDPVGNVTQANSTCPWLPNHTFTESFAYDAADQLVSASETGSNSYRLSVSYGTWGRVNTYDLTQTDLLQNHSFSNAATQNTYVYDYPGPGNLQYAQTVFAPAQRDIVGNSNAVTESFTFGINGSLRRRDNPQQSVTEYYLHNSSGNLKAYSNSGLYFAYYGYDAANTRTYKLSMLNLTQWINGQPQPIHPQIQQAMFYPNAYLNFNQNGEYTKHYYNGSERIASRLGNATMNIAATANARLNTRSIQLEDCFRNDIRTLVYAGDIPMDMPPEPVSATSLQQTGTPNDIFYYHTNHLGSTAFVTDNNATITQGFLYAPFGEITTEYNANFGNNVLPKYTFNAKELDEETGMYYYEARYYKPPVFTSRDPMFEKYFFMSPYGYCMNNPVGHSDPTGCDTVNISYNTQSNKWEIGKVSISEGADVFNVTGKDGSMTQTVFNEGKYGEKVSVLNVDGYSNCTLGIYHFSGKNDDWATGYAATPKGAPSTVSGSHRRLPDGMYPMSPTRGTTYKWVQPVVDISRAIKMHPVGNSSLAWSEVGQWTTGCYIVGTEYSIKGNNVYFNTVNSHTTSKSINMYLGASATYDHIGSRNYPGAVFNNGMKKMSLIQKGGTF